jgi:hypothetical protein
MKVLIICLFVLAKSATSFACHYSADCDPGQACVKPRGSYSLEGVCVTKTNEYGTPIYTQPRYQPEEVKSCSYKTDCQIGYDCVKRNNEIYGLCIKIR